MTHWRPTRELTPSTSQRCIATLLSSLLSALLFAAGTSDAQGTLEDYRRAATVNQRYTGLTVGLISGGVNWIDNTNRFWYRVSVTGGNRFVAVDADAWTKQAAFDHDRLAAGESRNRRGR